jgi:hypothetical protein
MLFYFYERSKNKNMNEVKREDLKVGKLYYIETLTHDENGRLIANAGVSKHVGIFIELEYLGYSTNMYNAVFDRFRLSKFNTIKDAEDSTKFRVSLNRMFRFYEVKKFQTQFDMESRAVNLILQNITGEKFLIWQ